MESLSGLDLAEALAILLNVVKKCQVPKEERVAVQVAESTLRAWLTERAAAPLTLRPVVPSAAPSSGPAGKTLDDGWD